MAITVSMALFDRAVLTIYAENCNKLTKRGIIALADLIALQEILGVSFNDPSLLEHALVHSSYINENPGLALTSNERLEFLGDAVLGVIVAEKLYQDYPDFTEGEMTKLRAVLIRQNTLFHIAKDLVLGEYLYLGKGEEASDGRHKPTNLARALEALIAAIFLDQGQSATTDFVLRLLDKDLRKAINQGITHDSKSQLQHLIQAKQQQPPTYRVIKAEGPDHNKAFTVEVSAGDIVLGKGTGKSKKSAETDAARSALKRLSNSFTG